MSRFFEALNRAERERASRDEGKKREATSHGVLSDALSETPRTPRDSSPSAGFRPRHGQSPFEPIPKVPQGIEPHLVSLLVPTAFEAEQYRNLRLLLEQKKREAGLSLVAVSSPTKGDGKTLTAINLAGALAQAEDSRVLLLETDLRDPSAGGKIGLRNLGSPGLVGAVLDANLSLDDVASTHPTFKFSFIPAGPRPASPYEVLRSPRLSKLLDEARRRFDYIVLDTPPLVPFPDCRVIAGLADGFVVVVAAHKTARRLIEEAIEVVEPAKMLGIVYNQDDLVRHNYYRTQVHSANGSRKGWFRR